MKVGHAVRKWNLENEIENETENVKSCLNLKIK